MAVPSNPVRIYQSGNVGAQALQTGALDFINVLKQCVNGSFTDQQTKTVTITGSKAVLEFENDHGYYPYQVVKLTGTGSTMENKEFFVLNNADYSAKKFAIDLTNETGAIPNVITVKLPTLGWSVIEDTTDWFSFRPAVDNRIPLWRISKTATNPQPNTRQYYETYLARDVNMDGSLIKNYTPVQWCGSRYNNLWDVTNPIAWTIIADNDFMYFFINRPVAPYGNDNAYSIGNGNSDYWLTTPIICWKYGVPTMLIEDDAPREWITLWAGGVGTQWRDMTTYYDTADLRRSYVNCNNADSTFLTARTPYSFTGSFGYAKSVAGWGSGSNGLPYPTLGAYGMTAAKHPVAVQGSTGGVYGIYSGLRSFLSEVNSLFTGSRTPVPWGEKKISPKSLQMGVFEMHTSAGKAPVFLTIGSRDGYSSGYTEGKRGTMCGIRIGCSWDTADLGVY